MIHTLYIRVELAFMKCLADFLNLPPDYLDAHCFLLHTVTRLRYTCFGMFSLHLLCYCNTVPYSTIMASGTPHGFLAKSMLNQVSMQIPCAHAVVDYAVVAGWHNRCAQSFVLTHIFSIVFHLVGKYS